MPTRARGIDLIRAGVDADVLAARPGALYGALVSTAMTAQARGWSEIDWGYELDHPDSRLGAQNSTRRNGTREDPKRSRDRLARAWQRAAEHRAEDPDWTPDDARALARVAAQAARDVVADPDADLTNNERTVLDYFAKLADERGSDRLTIARAALLDGTGLGLTALRTALAGLARRELVTLAEAGAPRTSGRPVRSNVYRLGLTPRAGLAVPVAPARSVSGAPTDQTLGAPRSVSGAPGPLPAALAAYLRTTEGAAAARLILDGQE